MAERRTILAGGLGFSILHSRFFISLGFLFPETFAETLDEIHVFVEDGQDDGIVIAPNEEDVVVLATVDERICEAF